MDVVDSNTLRVTYVGGPTAIFEIDGIRFLTDPTFDPAGTTFDLGRYSLHKLQGPSIEASVVGPIDAVLLSHDHHWDNFDRAGHRVAAGATRVLTTVAGAERLGGSAVGLAPWQSIDVQSEQGRAVRVTGTPGRHGPPDGDRGPVTGFVLSTAGAPGHDVYISGDTVWYEGIEEIARRFTVRTAVLFMGAACISEIGSGQLTMTAEDGVRAARAFADAVVVPLHFEGWKHLTESRDEIQRAFAAAGVADRLRWPAPGVPTVL